ncbi:hypothetical protein Tco_1061182 [Tanacetum coccineum]
MSFDSGRVLRSIAKLSLNSTSYNVVEKSFRKRKSAAVKLENKEESVEVNGLGLNVTDVIVSDVKVSMGVDIGVVTEPNGVVVSHMDTEQSDKIEIEFRC